MNVGSWLGFSCPARTHCQFLSFTVDRRLVCLNANTQPHLAMPMSGLSMVPILITVDNNVR